VSRVKGLHIRFGGFSASFRHPLIVSGTQISTPVPAYSHILGMISACAGRAVGPDETRVGFEMHCSSQGLELERTVRWQADKQGRLKPHRRGQSARHRQVYWLPILDLYVTNLKLRKVFERPIATPRFGRSQDIAWIEWCRDVELKQVESGAIGPTLIPSPQPGVGGLLVSLPEWFENGLSGCVRRPGPFGHYHAMSSTAGAVRYHVQRADLFHSSDAGRAEDVVYLHRWLEE
jgi:CRISPR-associated protein Cas5t